MPMYYSKNALLDAAVHNCLSFVQLQRLPQDIRWKPVSDLWQVDLVDFSGPIFEHVDNRFAALTLVQKGLCDAALFSPQGEQRAAAPALARLAQQQLV